MMVFNKLAIQAFPVECTLVAMQMAFSALVMIIVGWSSLHIGSFRDALRWSAVVPFFTGMLLTSILALKGAPMTLVITLKALSPVFSLVIERFYPNPIGVSAGMILSITAMIFGCVLYTLGMPRSHWSGVGWVFLNVAFSIADRLLQRLMLAKDQYPVDISKTGVTLLNNLEGLVPLVIVAWLTHEFPKVGVALRSLDAWGIAWVVASCIVGVGISYCGIWAQSLISATSFLVLVNANKFIIIFVEAFCIRSKTLAPIQVAGAVVAILAGVAYGKAREATEEGAKRVQKPADQTSPLVAKQV
eukprot:CAMPEP_0179094118 /NCGR_PEP_ID=MMETSP0796-20121207/43146_1 /TAXON_ID=73915 /ORGANISM="Pyrodinium bahamense, Strain pbaha01" /LENGTH=301 /DNA_ID=CAMNT_0020791781 /DNA_START=132 /DNA_END=1037 /DNA_ORIENTATION=-